MGDGVGVPAFREHGDRDDAAHMRPQGAGPAHGVDDFAEDFRISHLVGGGCAMHLCVFAFILRDLGGEDFFVVFIHHAGVFQGIGVDQDGAWFVEGLVGVRIEVGEEIEQAGGNECGLAIGGGGFLITGDVLENLFGNGGVIADDDEDRRGVGEFQLTGAAGGGGGGAVVEFIGVVPVEGIERDLQE